MRTRLFLLLTSTIAAAALAAHAQEAGSKSASDEKKPLKVVGCVAPDEANGGHFTLADIDTGAVSYRLSGKDLRRYVGKRVELIGAPPSSLKIIGGLTPSPNVAAQAGAMDPTQAAMAQQGSQGNARPGNILVPELRVTGVKGVAGDCNPR